MSIDEPDFSFGSSSDDESITNFGVDPVNFNDSEMVNGLASCFRVHYREVKLHVAKIIPSVTLNSFFFSKGNQHTK